MPIAQFGEKLNFSNNQFLKLKSKSDKVRFRLLGAPFIEGKHFFELEDGWDIQACPRINNREECQHCKKYFQIISGLKKTDDKTMQKQIQKEADPFKVSISVYYPIIDRLSAEFKVLQTTMGVRGKIETEVELGTKVLNVDFDLLRTELPGSDYYKLARVDSAETTPLLPQEEEIVAKYTPDQLEKIVNGSFDENKVAEEANTEVREDDAANF